MALGFCEAASPLLMEDDEELEISFSPCSRLWPSSTTTWVPTGLCLRRWGIIPPANKTESSDHVAQQADQQKDQD
jgi:hypothetical protein